MLRQIFTNWPLKLLALALGFTLWFSITGQSLIVKDFTVPLEIQLPEDRILAVTPPTTATVRLRGPEPALRRVESVELRIRIDLEPLGLGQSDIPLSSDTLTGVPRGVELDFINPDRVSLVVDRKKQRVLPVEPTFLDKPPAGFAFYGAVLRPERVRVEGPEAEIDALEILRTNPIRLNQRTAPFSIPVAAVPDGAHVRVVDENQVELHVVVDVTPEEARYEGVAVESRGAAPGVQAEVQPGQIDVRLSAPPALLRTIRSDLLSAVVDASGLTAGQHDLPVHMEFMGTPLEQRARISVESLSRRHVRVKLTKGAPAS